MKLARLPEGLPIDAVHDVTSLLTTLIASLKSREVFLNADNIEDYNETLSCLEEDVDECISMYKSWQQEPNASDYEVALAKMEKYIAEADALIRQANAEVVH